MRNSTYCKNYVSGTDPEEIERILREATFKSRGLNLRLKYFQKDTSAPSILCIPGTGDYSLLGTAEILYHIYLRGYNVFAVDLQGHGDSEGKRGDFTIGELVENSRDAAEYISRNFNERIGVIGASLSGFVTFYLALAQAPIKSIVCQDPAILTEKEFQEEATKKAKRIIPMAKLLSRLFPRLKIPTSLYVDWKAFPETDAERELLEKFMNDPDFVKWYTLRGALSQIQTPPPNPIEKLKMPIMIVAPTRDKLMPLSYVKNLYNRIPPIKKKLVEVDGGHFWMFSHPKETVEMICGWFNETV